MFQPVFLLKKSQLVAQAQHQTAKSVEIKQLQSTALNINTLPLKRPTLNHTMVTVQHSAQQFILQQQLTKTSLGLLTTLTIKHLIWQTTLIR
jgi:hypothetical protein